MFHTLLAKKYIHIIAPLFLGSVVAYLDRVNVAFAALTMNADMGFTPEVYGMGAGILFFGYMVFGLPGSLIASKWSPSKWIAFILVAWGSVLCLMPFMQSAWQFYVYRFLLGACEASFFPVVYAVIMPPWFNQKERPAAMSLFLSSMLISAIIGAPVAGVLLDLTFFGLHGWQTLFLLEAIPAILLGIYFFFCLPDTPCQASWLTEEEKEQLTAEYLNETETKNAAQKFTVWQALKDTKVLTLCGIFFLWMIGFWGFNFWMPTALKEVTGWSNSQVGLLITIPMVITFIVFNFWGAHSSRTGDKKWHMVLPLFLGAVAMGLSPFVHDAYMTLVLITLSAIGLYVGLGVWWSYPTTFLSGAAAAAGTSLINSIGCTSGWVGPYFIGVLNSLTGSFHYAYLGMALCIALAACWLLYIGRTNKKQTREVVKQVQSLQEEHV